MNNYESLIIGTYSLRCGLQLELYTIITKGYKSGNTNNSCMYVRSVNHIIYLVPIYQLEFVAYHCASMKTNLMRSCRREWNATISCDRMIASVESIHA